MEHGKVMPPGCKLFHSHDLDLGHLQDSLGHLGSDPMPSIFRIYSIYIYTQVIVSYIYTVYYMCLSMEREGVF